MYPIITKEIQKEFEENILDSRDLSKAEHIPNICGVCGRSCRQMENSEGANTANCMDCSLARFAENKNMPKMVYKVPVVWSMMGYVLVDAHDAEEAKEYVNQHLDEFELPSGEYLEGSFQLDEEGEPFVCGAYLGN